MSPEPITLWQTRRLSECLYAGGHPAADMNRSHYRQHRINAWDMARGVRINYIRYGVAAPVICRHEFNRELFDATYAPNNSAYCLIA